MDYNLSFSPRAKIVLNQAFDYYASKSETAMVNFLAELEFAYKTLKTNPYFQIRYKNVRALPICSFPYILFFTNETATKNVFIRSFFNTYQNPMKYPK